MVPAQPRRLVAGLLALSGGAVGLSGHDSLATAGSAFGGEAVLTVGAGHLLALRGCRVEAGEGTTEYIAVAV